MKETRGLTLYMSSADINVNASISLRKLFKRIRDIDPTYRPSSRYQARLKHKHAARRATLHIVR